MTDARTPNPTAVARERLDRAVTRLETAARTHLEAEVSHLGGLRRELEAARRENTTLKHTNEAVSRRLDDTIGRLGAVLED